MIVAATGVARADDLKPPSVDLEVAPQTVIVSLPAVPAFAVPSPSNGVHELRELRVNGRPLAGTEIKVHGYITWIYDCVTDVIRPGKTRAQVQKAIDDDPTLCQRPKFHLGATPDASEDVTLWVVDVPRAPNKLERKMLSKDDIAKWPTPPKFAVGDYVVVTGTFDYASPHSERNSDGLVVFHAIQPAPVTVSAASIPLPALKLGTLLVPQPVAATPPSPAALAGSKIDLASGNRLFANKRYGEAMTSYRDAIAKWNGNHLAWYALGAAAYELHDYKTAVDALKHAVDMVPSSPVYQLVVGVAMFESIVADARDTTSPPHFDRALDHLLLAASLEPRMWRAHYFIGKAMRAGDHAREAAGEFVKAIQANPRAAGPYIALAELYRRWDFTDAAIATAQQGVANVPGETSDLWFVLGSALADKHADAEAIDALSKALDQKRDYLRARALRGQLYLRRKQKPEAKRDLELVAASTDPKLEFERSLAQKLLFDLGARP
jgi:tetratricopeptide (TPR) repeat protein